MTRMRDREYDYFVAAVYERRAQSSCGGSTTSSAPTDPSRDLALSRVRGGALEMRRHPPFPDFGKDGAPEIQRRLRLRWNGGPLAAFSFGIGGDMIAATEIAMPAIQGHSDDFLFEYQCPKSWLAEQPTSSGQPNAKTPADELLERFLRRLRMQTPFTRHPQPQPEPRPGVVGICFTREIVAAFQSVWKDYLVKHPPQPPRL